MKTDKEQDLIKKIAYHEVYSTAYKIQLAKNVVTRGLNAGGNTLFSGGKKLIRFMKPKMSMGIKGLEWLPYESENEMRVKALNKQTFERKGLWDQDAVLFFDTLTEHPNIEGILARYKGKIVGSSFIKTEVSNKSIEILYPCVAEAWKSIGIEEALLLEILKSGIHNNYLIFTINSKKHAIEDYSLFEKLGFKNETTAESTLYIKEVNKNEE